MKGKLTLPESDIPGQVTVWGGGQAHPPALCACGEQLGLCLPGSGCHGRFCFLTNFYSQEVAKIVQRGHYPASP